MKKLVVLVLLALLAGACGGSDAEEAITTEELLQEPAETGDTGDTETGSAVDPDSSSDEAQSPAPVRDRDCAHTSAELGGDDDGADPEIDVPLPPAVKPDVDDTYLTDVDELITTDLIVGTGEEALTGATVEMQYVGVLASDGTEFDASWNREGPPFSFTLGGGQVIAGWDEGIVGMKVGGRRVLQIPAALAYGDQARGAVIGANADLVFIVDLVNASAAPEPAPPIDADNLGSFGELQIIDLVEGEGCTAEIGDIVSVNYVGVDAVTGEEFDSSWGRGAPFELIVGRSQVIDGWNEGIAGMKVGGERIIQIPTAMAYNEGDLVFRVHLEALVEAPEAHKVELEGPAPSEIQIETLREGSGDGAEAGDILETNILVMLYNSNLIVQSSWQQAGSTELALTEGSLIPGLEQGLEGIKVGELRQIVLPPTIAYPEGIPPNAGLEADDALVFIVEPIAITSG